MKPNQINYSRHILAILIMYIATGCGSADFQTSSQTPLVSPTLPPVGTLQANTGIFVKAQAVFNITSEAPTLAYRMFRGLYSQVMSFAYAAQATEPISVVNAPNTTMVMSSATWVVPAIKNAMLAFGSLKITSLVDNNLAVCGTGTQKCGNAVIQIFTTGPAGAGLWNAADSYGLPITETVTGTTATATVGLNTAGAVTPSALVIPATKHAILQTDFVPALSYNVNIDFTNAGTGSYSTTLVIQYGLTL